MRYCAPKAILVGVLAILTACGENTPTTPTGGGIRVGLWQGTLPSAPSGSGTLSFRVTSQTSMTFMDTRVPTLSSQAGCTNSWNWPVTIGSDRAFSATLSDDVPRFADTILTIAGIFDGETAASGTITGTCNGALMLSGQTFRADWVSN